MSNHIAIEGKVYQLTNQQAEAIAAAIRETGVVIPDRVKLSDIPVGGVASIGGTEFVVLEYLDGETALITKDCIGEDSEFGEDNNNYNGSYVDAICESFVAILENIAGEGNLVEFDVDLTSDDGLKDYGQIRRKCALMTADMYR